LVISKKTFPEIRSEMHNLGYQIPKTKQQRNQILAGLADPPLKK